MTRLIVNGVVPEPAVVPTVSVGLPSVRPLKIMPLSAWTAVLTLVGTPAEPMVRLDKNWVSVSVGAAPSEPSPAMIKVPARSEVPPV